MVEAGGPFFKIEVGLNKFEIAGSADLQFLGEKIVDVELLVQDNKIRFEIKELGYLVDLTFAVTKGKVFANFSLHIGVRIPLIISHLDLECDLEVTYIITESWATIGFSGEGFGIPFSFQDK